MKRIQAGKGVKVRSGRNFIESFKLSRPSIIEICVSFPGCGTVLSGQSYVFIASVSTMLRQSCSVGSVLVHDISAGRQNK